MKQEHEQQPLIDMDEGLVLLHSISMNLDRCPTAVNHKLCACHEAGFVGC